MTRSVTTERRATRSPCGNARKDSAPSADAVLLGRMTVRLAGSHKLAVVVRETLARERGRTRSARAAETMELLALTKRGEGKRCRNRVKPRGVAER